MNSDNMTLDELTDAAEDLEAAGDLEEALHFWKAATLKSPDPIILCRFGDLATRMGMSSEAEEAFRSAIKLEPGLPNPYNLLGILYLESGRTEEAVEQFEQGLKRERTPSTLTMLGVAHLELDRVSEAQSDFESALRLEPNYEEALYHLGSICRETEPQKAIELFEKALAIDPEYSAAHRELGWLHRGLDQYPEAEYHLRRALEIDESDGWAYIYLGNTLWAEGDPVSAEDYFKMGIEVWPDDSEPYWCLALFYEYEGRETEALDYYRQAVAIDPADPIANRSLERYLAANNQNEKAAENIKRVLAH